MEPTLNEKIASATDVYSVGSIMYDMITGAFVRMRPIQYFGSTGCCLIVFPQLTFLETLLPLVLFSLCFARLALLSSTDSDIRCS